MIERQGEWLFVVYTQTPLYLTNLLMISSRLDTSSPHPFTKTWYSLKEPSPYNCPFSIIALHSVATVIVDSP